MHYNSTSGTQSRKSGIPTVQDIKAMYPAGTRICVDKMGANLRGISDGMCGTVRGVNDAGAIRCAFDNRRVASVLVGEDRFHVL